MSAQIPVVLFLAGLAAGYVYGSRDAEKKKPLQTGSLSGDGNGEFKMVLVVRTDLQMTKGKIAAQAAHAALDAYEYALRRDPDAVRQWKTTGQAKIALRADSERELLLLQQKAESAGLVARLVVDAGRTQIKAGSVTVLGVGPASKSDIDKVTGHLKLL